MALFDLDTGDYGTYTDYDMPPANMEPGAQRKLAMAAGLSRPQLPQRRRHRVVDARAATATGNCCPITYRVSLVGQDHSGRSDAAGLGRNSNARTDTGGRVDLQREDRLLRPKRHLLVFPDRNGDDRNAALGRRGRAGLRQRRARRPAVVPEVRRRWRKRGRPAGQVARMAHDQLRQRRRPEHLAAVRPHERQCAAALYRRDDELSRPGHAAGVRRGRGGDGQQLRPLAECGAAAGAAAGSGPVHAGSPPDHLRHTATGHHRGAAGGGPGTRPADRIHGRSRTATTERCGANR